MVFLAAPVCASAQSASVTAAIVETANIAGAMEQVAIDTGTYTTIENLDDLPGPTDTYEFDWINFDGGALVLRPAAGRFEPSRVILQPDPFDPFSGWQGPYLTAFTNDDVTGPTDPYDEGSPLDPWGEPYYFFTPLGLAVPRSGTVSLDLYGDDFDRYAIVSLGPDGTVSGDDIVARFGGAVTELAISSARLAVPAKQAAAPIELRVKGYRFGNSQGTGAVLVNGSEVDGTVLEWTDRLVRFALPTPPAAGAPVALRADSGAVAEAVPLQNETTTSVPHWDLY